MARFRPFTAAQSLCLVAIWLAFADLWRFSQALILRSELSWDLTESWWRCTKAPCNQEGIMEAISSFANEFSMNRTYEDVPVQQKTYEYMSV